MESSQYDLREISRVIYEDDKSLSIVSKKHKFYRVMVDMSLDVFYVIDTTDYVCNISKLFKEMKYAGTISNITKCEEYSSNYSCLEQQQPAIQGYLAWINSLIKAYEILHA